MRIGTQLSEDDSERVQKLADRRGLQKDRAYTELIRTGVDVGMRRDRIKELIVEFFEEEKVRHERRMDALREEYGIDEVEYVDEGQFYVRSNGNKYDFGSPDDLLFVNGESVDRHICPECGSEEIEFDADAMDTDELYWSCEECGHEFDRADRKGVPDEDEADQVMDFARRRQDLFDYVVGQLTALLDGMMCSYGGSGYTEWLGPGGFMYSNGFQRVDIPFWTTDTEQIRFQVDGCIGSYESLRNPLYPAALNRLSADYLQLVREIEAVNPRAERVRPVIIDSRGRKPEIIEVVGLEYDETWLPLHSVGYDVEKVDPSAEELEPEHEADAAVTWIRITNDKPIEKQGGER